MKKKQRFQKTNHSGIRKDLTNRKFEVRKQIDGRAYREIFDSISDAITWKSNYHPSLTFTDTNDLLMKENLKEDFSDSINSKKIIHNRNGTDYGYKVKDIWKFYLESHVSSLEKSTQRDRGKFGKGFLDDLMNFKMTEINSFLLDEFIKNQKRKALRLKKRRRLNFNEDFKILRAFFNWYRENYDGQFVDPILKRHKALGIIQTKKIAKKKMTLEQFSIFLDGFESQFWKDFAETQFFFSGRVQESAGLQVGSVDFSKSKIEIVDVTVWGEDKKFWYLKNVPKNGSERWTHLNSRLSEILKRRVADRPSSPFEYFCEESGESLNFVFHIDGVPLSYRQIQYRYNKALKKVGLDKLFSSTHFLRKAMAKATREHVGLDAAQAVGGWKSRDIVEDIYTDIPMELTIQASNTVEKLLYGEKSTPPKSPNDEEKGRLRLIS